MDAFQKTEASRTADMREVRRTSASPTAAPEAEPQDRRPRYKEAIKEAAFAHELVSIIVGSGYDVSRRLDQGAAMTWSTYRPVCLIAAAML